MGAIREASRMAPICNSRRPLQGLTQAEKLYYSERVKYAFPETNAP